MTSGSVVQGSFPAGLARILGASVVQRRATPTGSAVLLPQQQSAFHGGGPGTQMPADVRQLMEGAFRTSFADVRIHVGMDATAMGAVAFTRGSHIYFAPGRFSPSTPHGRELLAHELAHVVQQRSGRVRNPFGQGVAVVHDAMLEAEADRLARKVVQPQRTVQRSTMSDEDKKKMEARKNRFAKELDSLEKQKEAKKLKVDALRKKVKGLIDDLNGKKVKIVIKDSAYKHSYKDPDQEFLTALPKTKWSENEAAWDDGKNELTVTVYLSKGNTVAGVYDTVNTTLTIIHCGETSSGIGYGTNLADVD